MAAATNKISEVEVEILVKQDRLHKLLVENHNRSSPELDKAFSEAFTDLFWATWKRIQDRSTPRFDDEIGSIAIDSQVEIDVEKLESKNKDRYDLIGAVVLDSATTNRPYGFGESKVLEDKIDGELKSIPLDSSSADDFSPNSSTLTATDEGKIHSKLKFDFSSVDGTIYSIQDYKEKSMFLDYQENVHIDFNVSAKFLPQGTFVCDQICEFNFTKILFDRGKLFEIMFWKCLPKYLASYCSIFSQRHTYTAEVNNYRNPCYLKEFFYLLNNLHSQDCSHLILVDIRSLFDRGKCTTTAWSSYELNCLVLHIFGYQSEFSIVPSIIIVCVKDNLISEGRKMLGSILMNGSIKKIAYEPYVKLWYILELLTAYSSVLGIFENGDNGYGWQLFLEVSQRNNIASYGGDLTLFGRGRMGETIPWSSHMKCTTASCSILIHNIHQYTGMIDPGLVLMCAKGGECYYFVLIFTRRVIDRGKMFELSSSSTSSAGIKSKQCVYILTYYVVIPHGLNFEHKNDWKIVFEHVRKLGYLFKFSSANLMVILSVVDGGSGAAIELSYIRQLQCDSLWITLLSFQMPRLGMYGNVAEFFNQLLGDCFKFKFTMCFLGFFHLQHWILYCHMFLLSVNHGAWEFRFMRTYYTSDRKICFPMLKVLNSAGATSTSQGAIIWNVTLLQVTIKKEFGKAPPLFDQILGSSGWGFQEVNGYLHCILLFPATHKMGNLILAIVQWHLTCNSQMMGLWFLDTVHCGRVEVCKGIVGTMKMFLRLNDCEIFSMHSWEVIILISVSGNNASGLAADSCYPLFFMTFMSASVLQKLRMGSVTIYRPLQVLPILPQNKWCCRKVEKDGDVRHKSSWCGVFRNTSLIAGCGDIWEYVDGSIYTAKCRSTADCILVTLDLMDKLRGKILLLGLIEGHANFLYHYCAWGINAINIDSVSFINADQTAASEVSSVMFLGVKIGKGHSSLNAREEATMVVINHVISNSREVQHLCDTDIMTIMMHEDGSSRTYSAVSTEIFGSSSAEEISTGESSLLIDMGGTKKAHCIFLHRLQIFMPQATILYCNHQPSDTISLQHFMHTHRTTKRNLLAGYLLTASPSRCTISCGARFEVWRMSHFCVLASSGSSWISIARAYFSSSILEDKDDLEGWVFVMSLSRIISMSCYGPAVRGTLLLDVVNLCHEYLLFSLSGVDVIIFPTSLYWKDINE